MSRTKRNCPAGVIFHCLNRAVARQLLFEKPQDYLAFELLLAEVHSKVPLRILDYTVMPNHWHFIVWPETDSQVSEFFRLLTGTHSMRWHAHYKTSGTGHLYQGRFKSFPIQNERYLVRALRYVERNPVRAGLVGNAEDWQWGSAWRREQFQSDDDLLADWPMAQPKDWLNYVNQPQTEEEVAALRKCVQRGAPYGDEKWTKIAANRLGIEYTLRNRGRPSRFNV